MFLYAGVIQDLPQVESDPDNNVDFYKWKIENKYYEASVHFCKIPEKNVLMQQELRTRIEAVIVYFDSQKVVVNLFHLAINFAIQNFILNS